MSSISNANTWAGRIVSGLVVLFLLFDCSMKLMKLAPAVEGTVQLGYPANLLFSIGVIELICVVLYMIPRSAALGAILLTGYLGGAVATHLRLGNPLFTHILFPIYVGAFIWGGLYLRDRRLRALIAS